MLPPPTPPAFVRAHRRTPHSDTHSRPALLWDCIAVSLAQAQAVTVALRGRRWMHRD
jgi:hypothetical protein